MAALLVVGLIAMSFDTITMLAGCGLLLAFVAVGALIDRAQRHRPDPIPHPVPDEPERHAWPEPMHPRITDRIAHPPARHTPETAEGTWAQRWKNAAITGEIVRLDEETVPVVHAVGRAAVQFPGGLRTVPDWPGRAFEPVPMPLAEDWFSAKRMRVEVDA